MLTRQEYALATLASARSMRHSYSETNGTSAFFVSLLLGKITVHPLGLLRYYINIMMISTKNSNTRVFT